FAGDEDVVAVLDNGAAAEAAASAAAAGAGVAPRDRRAGVVVRRVLLAIPDLPRRRARFHDPRPRAARGAIVFAQERDAGVRVGDAAVPPFGLRQVGRLAGE